MLILSRNVFENLYAKNSHRFSTWVVECDGKEVVQLGRSQFYIVKDTPYIVLREWCREKFSE